jgi:hypothetical protein
MNYSRRVYRGLAVLGMAFVLAFHASAARLGGAVEESACTPVALTTASGDAATASLVAISGSLSLCEVQQGGDVNYWPVGSIDLKNTGKQTGVTVAVTIDLLYPHGERGTRRVSLDDSLLATGIFKVGKTLTFKADSAAKTWKLGTAQDSKETWTPTAVARVTYLELADGTAVGTAPGPLVQERARELAALRAVESAYVTGGVAGFISAVQKGTGIADVDFLLHGVAGTQRLSGNERALSQLKERIQKAELRGPIPAR